jgi:hypothetical protein
MRSLQTRSVATGNSRKSGGLFTEGCPVAVQRWTIIIWVPEAFSLRIKIQNSSGWHKGLWGVTEIKLKYLEVATVYRLLPSPLPLVAARRVSPHLNK